MSHVYASVVPEVSTTGLLALPHTTVQSVFFTVLWVLWQRFCDPVTLAFCLPAKPASREWLQSLLASSRSSRALLDHSYSSLILSEESSFPSVPSRTQPFLSSCLVGILVFWATVGINKGKVLFCFLPASSNTFQIHKFLLQTNAKGLGTIRSQGQSSHLAFSVARFFFFFITVAHNQEKASKGKKGLFWFSFGCVSPWLTGCVALGLRHSKCHPEESR